MKELYRYSLACCFLLAAVLGLCKAEPACCPAPDCAQECVKKCCVPTWEMKKHTHVNYGCKKVDFCVPKCCGGHCGHKHDGCDACDGCHEPGHACGKPRCRNVLIKKFVTEERHHAQCAVVHEPVCNPCCPPACAAGHVPLMPPAAEPGAIKGEPIPAPKKEVKD
jgi:hypothetical protein